MSTRSLSILTLAAVAATFPAQGAVTVIGTSAARSCYESAESSAHPSRSALSLCDRALFEEPLLREEVVATHVNRGILRMRSGDLDGGIADFDTALALDPNQPEAHLNKGIALIRRQSPDAALPLFSRAIELQTQRPELAYYARAVAYEDLGNIPLAYQDYRRASELDPDWRVPRRELQRFQVVTR